MLHVTLRDTERNVWVGNTTKSKREVKKQTARIKWNYAGQQMEYTNRVKSVGLHKRRPTATPSNKKAG